MKKNGEPEAGDTPTMYCAICQKKTVQLVRHAQRAYGDIHCIIRCSRCTGETAIKVTKKN